MIQVEVSPGELFDKITILEIKAERMSDPVKLAHVRNELAMLEEVATTWIPRSARLEELKGRLRRVNEVLWVLEDQVRACERRQEFQEGFVQLARSVYRENDRRAAIKREINTYLGSRLVEEKSYRPY